MNASPHKDRFRVLAGVNFRNVGPGWGQKAAQLLEPLLEAYPEHPGIAHFLIHSYDFPPLAEKGLVAARRYASIAPSAVVSWSSDLP